MPLLPTSHRDQEVPARIGRSAEKTLTGAQIVMLSSTLGSSYIARPQLLYYVHGIPSQLLGNIRARRSSLNCGGSVKLVWPKILPALRAFGPFSVDVGRESDPREPDLTVCLHNPGEWDQTNAIKLALSESWDFPTRRIVASGLHKRWDSFELRNPTLTVASESLCVLTVFLPIDMVLELNNNIFIWIYFKN